MSNTAYVIENKLKVIIHRERVEHAVSVTVPAVVQMQVLILTLDVTTAPVLGLVPVKACGLGPGSPSETSPETSWLLLVESQYCDPVGSWSPGSTE